MRSAVCSKSGLTRAAAVLILVAAVLLVVVAIPVWRAYKYQADRMGCKAGLKTATDSLIIERLQSGDTLTLEEAYDTLALTMPGREDLCPAKGNIFLIKNDHTGAYDFVCGLHGPDPEQRTRLNSSYVLTLLRQALKKELLYSDELPESLTVESNGSDLECERVSSEVDIRRGTALTHGYEGVVAFFGVAGDGDWPESEEPGEIVYFLYADEDSCAVWRQGDGWTGIAYGDLW